MSDNPVFSYTRRDFESSRQEGLSQIPALSNGAWTDLNPTDPGIIILDYVHALVDMINFYQDHQALETFLPTAKERDNIFRLAKQFSYSIKSAKGAEVDVRFYSDFIYDFPIKIPRYTSISTDMDIKYLTTEDAYLQAGTSEVVIHCKQGYLNKMTYTGTGVSRKSNIENAKNQEVLISLNTVDTTSITITDDKGEVWTPVDHIVFSNDIDKVYQIDLNPNNTVTIKFGDGERGVVPQITDVLTIEYITTDAEEGRVGAHSLTILDDSIMHEGKVIEFNVDNELASVGGASAQSSSSIRELAPAAIKSQGRAVTLEDFENLAKSVDGVADAKAYDINTKPDLCLYHEVKVLIIPVDENSSKSVLSKNVYNYLSKRMIPPTNLQVLTPSSIPIDIELTVKKLGDHVDDGSLEYEIHDKVKEYFKKRYSDVGEDFYPADLSAVINNLERVKYVLDIKPSSIVPIAELSIATLGNLVIHVQ